MNVLELFAGSRSIGKVGDKLGMNVFSVDWEKYDDIDLCIDVAKLKKEDIPFIPDLIWASPDCTTYSIAAISTHRNNTEPKSEYAKKCDITNQHFISLIKEWLDINPNMVFFIENPRGMLRKMPWMQEFKRHTIWYCFAGETEVITKEGYKQFKNIVNTNQLLLMKDGSWKEAPIKHFGQQEIYKLTLSRAGSKKVIRTTKNHKWFIRLINRRVVIVNTIDLKKSDVIPSIYSNHTFEDMDNDSIAKGFIFGDGWANYRIGKNKQKVPYDSVAQFCGRKEELVKFFENLGRSRRHNKGHLNIAGLPFEWKKYTPTIGSDTPNQIYGWLAGYFAADGTVGKNGQVKIHSSIRENLEVFRDLCQSIGIGTYDIATLSRKGYGEEKTNLYSLGLIRTTMPNDFFLLSHHKENSFQPKYEPYWSVVSVESENVIEDVYCAQVDEYESFVLASNILTHNCTYGDERAKPTDIWTNSDKWIPRPVCHNGNKECHHTPAPRGSKTGTQGRKGSYERSKIPEQLCYEVLESLNKPNIAQ